MSSDRSTRDNYLQSESQHGRLYFLISVNFDILLGFWFLFWGVITFIYIYIIIIHFWNTLTLRKVQLPTDVSRLNCVFERNGDMIPRAQTICALIVKYKYCIKYKLKKNECHYFHLVVEGGGGGGSMFLKAELYSIKMVNSTGEKSRVRGVISKWGGGGAHIALLPVTSKIISINIHVHYIFLMTVIFQLLSICQNRLDPSCGESLFS